MREIRQKPEGREQRILHRTGRIPKSVIRDMAARSKEKAVDEMKSAPFGNRQEESSNTPVNDAGEQMVSTAKDTAKKRACFLCRFLRCTDFLYRFPDSAPDGFNPFLWLFPDTADLPFRIRTVQRGICRFHRSRIQAGDRGFQIFCTNGFLSQILCFVLTGR